MLRLSKSLNRDINPHPGHENSQPRSIRHHDQRHCNKEVEPGVGRFPTPQSDEFCHVTCQSCPHLSGIICFYTPDGHVYSKKHEALSNGNMQVQTILNITTLLRPYPSTDEELLCICFILLKTCQRISFAHLSTQTHLQYPPLLLEPSSIDGEKRRFFSASKHACSIAMSECGNVPR